MPANLRPLSLGELLDRTFTLYRQNFVLFLGISCIPAAAVLAVSVLQDVTLIGSGTTTPRGVALAQANTAIFTTLITIIAYFVGAAFSQAAAVKAVSWVHLERPITIAEAFDGVSRRFGSVLGVMLLILLIALGPFLVLILVSGVLIAGLGAAARGGGGAAMAALFGLFFLVSVLGGGAWAIYLYLKYAVAIPASVVEELTTGKALKRSATLTQGGRGRIFVVYFVLGVVGFAIGFAMQLPTQALAVSLILKGNAFLGSLIAQVVQFIASALAAPIGVIAVPLIYYDQRVRKEAFDIELMMREAEGGPSPSAAAATMG